MFAAVINFLTITAFTVHAVSGCCVHHHHHIHADSCDVAHTAGLCSHHVANETTAGTLDHDQGHGCCHHDHDSQLPEVASEEVPADSPCDGSHDCKEPRCTFVAAPAQTLENVVLIPQSVAYFGDLLALCQFNLAIKSKLSWRFETCSPPKGGRAHRALLQSWQI